jgi:hypothetical protein
MISADSVRKLKPIKVESISDFIERITNDISKNPFVVEQIKSNPQTELVNILSENYPITDAKYDAVKEIINTITSQPILEIPEDDIPSKEQLALRLSAKSADTYDKYLGLLRSGNNILKFRTINKYYGSNRIPNMPEIRQNIPKPQEVAAIQTKEERETKWKQREIENAKLDAANSINARAFSTIISKYADEFKPILGESTVAQLNRYKNQYAMLLQICSSIKPEQNKIKMLQLLENPKDITGFVFLANPPSSTTVGTCKLLNVTNPENNFIITGKVTKDAMGNYHPLLTGITLTKDVQIAKSSADMKYFEVQDDEQSNVNVADSDFSKSLETLFAVKPSRPALSFLSGITARRNAEQSGGRKLRTTRNRILRKLSKNKIPTVPTYYSQKKTIKRKHRYM